MTKRYILIPGDSPYLPKPDVLPVLWAELEDDDSGVLHDNEGNTRPLQPGWDEEALIEEYLAMAFKCDPDIRDEWWERIYDWAEFERKRRQRERLAAG